MDKELWGKVINNLVECLKDDLGKIDDVSKANIEVYEKEKVIGINVYTDSYEVDYRRIIRTILRDTRVVKGLFNLDIHVYHVDRTDIRIYTSIRILDEKTVIEISGELRYDIDSFIYYVNSLGLGKNSVKIIDYVKNNPKEIEEEISKARDYVISIINRLFSMCPKYKVFDRYEDLSKCDKYDTERYISIRFEAHPSKLNNVVINNAINELANLLYNIYDAISDKIYERIKEKALSTQNRS